MGQPGAGRPTCEDTVPDSDIEVLFIEKGSTDAGSSKS
jgi:hypothetical protein